MNIELAMTEIKHGIDRARIQTGTLIGYPADIHIELPDGTSAKYDFAYFIETGGVKMISRQIERTPQLQWDS